MLEVTEIHKPDPLLLTFIEFSCKVSQITNKCESHINQTFFFKPRLLLKACSLIHYVVTAQFSLMNVGPYRLLSL